MISVDQNRQVHFLGKRSSTTEREFLRERGFIHVTGLPVCTQGLLHYIGDKLLPGDCGVWNTNNGMTAVTTTGGEIWVRSGACLLSSQEQKFLLLKGRGGTVPLSGQSELLLQHRLLLDRVLDSDAGLIFSEKVPT